MDFLRCVPTVFLVENDYEIAINTKEAGIIYLRVGSKFYYAENAGVLASEKKFAQIRVPKNALDEQETYTVLFKRSIDRRAYFSVMDAPVSQTFSFRPILKKQEIRIMHIADVHFAYDVAEKTAGYFGDETDLFIFNGDIGESESEEDFLKVYDFLGRVAEGKIPTLFIRGNHDTRGKFAERFTEYFPCVNGKTYYTVPIGAYRAVIFDCGEDKRDDYMAMEYPNPDVYGGTNLFHSYREKELDWLRSLKIEATDQVFAIGHIAPVMTTFKKGDEFDIERELYAEWNRELERLKVRFMLCGHLHRAFVLKSKDERNILEHAYPVIFGSEWQTANGSNRFIAAALTLSADKLYVRFVDEDKNVVEEEELLLRE